MNHSTPPTEPEIRAENESLGEMFKSLSDNLTTLIQQEIELGKAEISQAARTATDSAKEAGKGAGILGGAGVAGHFVLLFLSIALWWVLGHPVGHAWSAVIVAVIWAIIGAVLAVVGKKKLDTSKEKIAQATDAPLHQTRTTVSEIPDTLNPQKETP